MVDSRGEHVSVEDEDLFFQRVSECLLPHFYLLFCVQVQNPKKVCIVKSSSQGYFFLFSRLLSPERPSVCVPPNSQNPLSRSSRTRSGPFPRSLLSLLPIDSPSTLFSLLSFNPLPPLSLSMPFFSPPALPFLLFHPIPPLPFLSVIAFSEIE